MACLLLKVGIIARRIQQAGRNGFLILMYHRVLPASKVDWKIQSGMYVTPSTLSIHLNFLKRFFDIVPLSAMISSYFEPEVSERPLVALTFDDGWRDFYDYAYPVLKAYDLPATVFLATDFVGSHDMFWTDRVPDLLHELARVKKIVFEDDEELSRALQKTKELSGSKELRLEQAISILKPFPCEKIEMVFKRLLPDNPGKLAGEEGLFLNWDEVGEMLGSGLISFGSHTCSHQILTTLGEADIVSELADSKHVLLQKGVCKHDFIPFCYPNGNHTARIAEMVREAGYSMAVTTLNGWNRKNADPYTLKRVGIHNDMTFTESMFGAQIVSLFS